MKKPRIFFIAYLNVKLCIFSTKQFYAMALLAMWERIRAKNAIYLVDYAFAGRIRACLLSTAKMESVVSITVVSLKQGREKLKIIKKIKYNLV